METRERDLKGKETMDSQGRAVLRAGGATQPKDRETEAQSEGCLAQALN